MNTGDPWPEPDVARAWLLDVQQKLYRWARDEPQRRFSDLANLVYDRHSLVAAWDRVASRKGAHTAGVDGATRGSIERGVWSGSSPISETTCMVEPSRLWG